MSLVAESLSLSNSIQFVSLFVLIPLFPHRIGIEGGDNRRLYAKCAHIKQVIKWDFRELRAHFVLPLIPGFARKVVITLQK